jgi:putative flippase GtrA
MVLGLIIIVKKEIIKTNIEVKTLKIVLSKEFTKFLFIGLLAYITNVGLFNLLTFKGLLSEKPLTASTISTLVSFLVAYIGSNKLTFASQNKKFNKVDAVKFFVINVIGLLFSLISLATSHYIMGFHSKLADNIAANLIGIGLGTIFRFIAYKKMIYFKTINN